MRVGLTIVETWRLVAVRGPNRKSQPHDPFSISKAQRNPSCLVPWVSPKRVPCLILMGSNAIHV
eukprot:CAMPEP_0184684416 /NCGR_PEP_ID=MMETSP0312-20130426/15184_1 /TAXON_ID=31354 /ORGANISM="Compsopogon coeruleus, Strain SAG 36.94" /LENGTH=63 /DNA_ID=CAMNT_0027137559 /DNA_START=4773 /DNA_END=4961 /DNA_ORIENTATION=-